jgi:hypothetical protein
MQLEAVRRVSMRDLGLEVGGQIDDVDGVEGTFLRADTATDAEALRNEGDLGRVGHFDAQLARADNGTRLLAFLSTFLGRVSLARGGYGGLHSPWVCTIVANMLMLTLSKIVWRGSGACTLSELTIAILRKLA